MKFQRASNKLYHAIDAIQELREDYMDELLAAEVTEDIGRIADLLNEIDSKLIASGSR